MQDKGYGCVFKNQINLFQRRDQSYVCKKIEDIRSSGATETAVPDAERGGITQETVCHRCFRF